MLAKTKLREGQEIEPSAKQYHLTGPFDLTLFIPFTPVMRYLYLDRISVR